MSGTAPPSRGTEPARSTGMTMQLVLFWAFVGVPLLWGVSQTVANAAKLFQ